MGALDEDTIVAPATAAGRGGIGIVRLSGKNSWAIAQKITGKDLTPRRAEFVYFRGADGNPIDQGLALYFKGPHSFTGEDVIELHTHGNPVILDMLIAASVQCGARMARPGEFSERAFLNDKIDLAQAEAIADLIAAGSSNAVRSALASLEGVFSNEINLFLEGLVGLRAFIEAGLDFPEDEVDFLDREKILDQLDALTDRAEKIFLEARQGNAMNVGLTLVIAGRPNAGKSSLLNTLTRRESAIVTDVPGTTRDLIREQIYLDGIPLHIVDTAGLRESSDPIEQEGINRARREIERADHVLLVVDSSEPGSKNTTLEGVWPTTLGPAPKNIPLTVIMNKCDLSGLAPGPLNDGFVLSVRSGAGISQLREHLKKLAGFREGAACRFSARRRHLIALESVLAHLGSAKKLLSASGQAELLAEELRLCQQALESITGRFTPDDLLDKIFRDFCIGK